MAPAREAPGAGKGEGDLPANSLAWTFSKGACPVPFDLVSFGEALLRLSPPSPRRLEQSRQLDVFVAGSELNVATTAQQLGLRTAYMTKLPDNPLGRIVRNTCREHGIDTSYLAWSREGRMGLYFFEYGAAPRPSVAYYDRAHSAFSQAAPEDFAWDDALRGTKIFLSSGITPALGPSPARCVEHGLRRARELGCKVAFDLNYRSKLWSVAEASKAIKPLMEYVDILFASIADAHHLLGVAADPSAEVPRRVAEAYGIETVTTIYNPSEPGVTWRAATYHKGETYFADQTGPFTTVDRLGAGDAFAGGFLYGYLKEGVERAVRIGNACMALKNTVVGDLNCVSLEDVEDQIGGERTLVKR